MTNLREFRKSRNKKLREVAKSVGITIQSLSHYEVGKRKPDIFILKKLADYYDCSLDDFFKN